MTDSEIMSQAVVKVGFVIERAQREAQEIRYGADEYALSVHRQLEERLIEHLTTVQNGITTLDTSMREAETVAE